LVLDLSDELPTERAVIRIPRSEINIGATLKDHETVGLGGRERWDRSQ
jgi:hypothetical protein